MLLSTLHLLALPFFASMMARGVLRERLGRPTKHRLRCATDERHCGAG